MFHNIINVIKCPLVLSSKDHLIKEPKDFICEEVGLRIFSVKYKNAVEQEYLDIYNKILESIDDKGKLLLFKTLKTEYNLEFYLKYPGNARPI
jgi:tRNA(Leu) C34 or U34 (ribose-2'-O)-methylase TrmL